MGADRMRRLLVAMVLGGGMLLLAATPAFALHEGDGDGRHTCHLVDSNMADVEDDPVDNDTGGYYVCAGQPIPSSTDDDGNPRSHGDVGADTGGIVPAARIDAGGGATATAGNPAVLLGVLTGATGAGGAVVARRRR